MNRGLLLAAAVCFAEPAQARDLALGAEVGWALATTTAGTVGGPSLGGRAAVQLTNSFDLELGLAFSRHALPATDQVPADDLDLLTAGAGIVYHLDDLPVRPFLALGPEALYRTLGNRSETDPTLRISIGADWDRFSPLYLGGSINYHYFIADFPASSYLSAAVRVGTRL